MIGFEQQRGKRPKSVPVKAVNHTDHPLQSQIQSKNEDFFSSIKTQN
jgi:hypothetical protein